jgi:ubiquinone/menaquinone biosynthesis C-methylase UbiE
MKMKERESDAVRTSVRQHYGQVAVNERSCGCAPTCCSTTEETATGGRTANEVLQAIGYSADEIGAVPEGANLGLGCGNPLAIASLKPGQTVLDLGSGAGFDAFLAAKAVGATGLVIGVDMTPEMVSKARENKAKDNYENVDFRLGEIENLPVPNNSVDVIISNCVINLSPDKGQVFREAFRVLKSAGRLAISDILATGPLPEAIRMDLELHAGCVAGACLIEDVKRQLQAAGFADIRVTPKPQSRDFIREWFPGRGMEDYIVSATIEAVKS